MLHKLLYILLLMTALPVYAQDIEVDSCRHLSAEDFFIGITSCEYPIIIDTRSHEEFCRECIQPDRRNRGMETIIIRSGQQEDPGKIITPLVADILEFRILVPAAGIFLLA